MSSLLPLISRWRACLLGGLALILAITAATARPFWVQGDTPGSDKEFLPPDIAFRVGAHLAGNQLHLRWVIADGYYLYRDKFKVEPESPDLVLGPLQLPPGEPQTDAYFGTRQVYRHALEATVAVTRQDFGAHPLQVRVSYQGCADAGLCYPLLAKVLFPAEPDADRSPPAHPALRWQRVAIGGGCLAFLVAGLRRRRARTAQTKKP